MNEDNQSTAAQVSAPLPEATNNASQPAQPTIENVVTAEDLISIDDFAKVKLCVAKVEAAEKVEKSKKLIKLQLDLGPTIGKRQIVSGIALTYSPEQLVGRSIIVISNLKPAKLMGIESNGMLLAASDEGGKLTLLTVSEEISPGSMIS